MHKLIWRAPLAAALVALGMVSATTGSHAASGTAVGVSPAAAAETDVETRTLKVGSDVSIGERVVTGPKGQVQILFTDRTELVVGPNSALVIEDYLLRADESTGKFAINALSGTFRFATGRAPKDLYEIRTPTGTIGVRGTEFDFISGPQDTKVMLYGGSLILCNTKQTCVTLDNTCDLGVADPGQSQIVGNTQGFTAQQKIALRQDFIYAASQAALLGRFRFDEAPQCLQRSAATTAEPAESLLDGGGNAPPPPCNDCSNDLTHGP